MADDAELKDQGDEGSRLTNPAIRVVATTSGGDESHSVVVVNRRFLCGAVAFGLGCLLVGFVIGFDIRPVPLSPSSPTPPGTSPATPPQSVHSGGGDQHDTPPPSPQGSSVKPDFDISHLLAAQKQAQSEIDMLRAYYGKYTAKVLDGNDGLVFGFAGANGAPSNPESFRRTSDVIARALVHGETIKLGYIGSSVMCGHDNCYYDSFPAQLERLLNRTFAAAGSGVESRNACQGGTCGDSYENQIFCMQHMIGSDVDFVHYEWTYFEQNEPEQYHELATRFALNLPKSPPMFIFNCDTTPWAGNKRTNDLLAEAYAKYGANGASLVGGLMASGVYKGKVWAAVGDGMHDTTRYGASETQQARKESLGVVFRNWHPGPLGLQYVADLAGYLYLRALVDAVDRIKADASPKITWPKVPPPALELPKPVVIKDRLLLPLAMLEEPPGCLTVQLATFGQSTVVVSDNAEDTLNPYHDKVKKLSSSDDAWSLNVNAPNMDMVPRAERGMGAMCMPPDHCAYFVEPKAAKDTPLVFRLPKMSVGLIVLCGYGKSGGQAFSLPGAVSIEFDGAKLDTSHFTVFPQPKCTALQLKFAGPVHDTNGHLYLSIMPGTMKTKLSQVIVA